MAIKKTNVMRILDKAKIKYEALEYEYDENDLAGTHVADFLGFDYGEVFKTLVLRSAPKSFHVCLLAVDQELDLKKAARAIGVKKIEMLHVKELESITGYIRGGCSPIGMKSNFPVFIDDKINQVELVSISAGKRGTQVRLNKDDLINFTKATVVSLSFDKEEE